MILVISNMYPSKKAPNYGVFVKNFCDQLKKKNEVKIISLTKQTNFFLKCIHYFVFYIKVFFHYVFGKYELAYIHYAGYNSPPVLLGKIFNKKMKLIVNVHGSDVTPEKKLEEKTNFLTKILVRTADLVVVPSSYFAEVVKEKYGEVATFISPSAGIDLQLFKTSNEIKKNVDQFTLGYVGRIDNEKGWDSALLAFHSVSQKIPNSRLMIIGSGKQNEQLNEMIVHLNLEEKVEKIEMLDQKKLAEKYLQLDVFLFPSTRAGESLGLVGLEAMACGIPVIGSNFGGIKTYVESGRNGILFHPGSVTDLEKSILEYFNYSKEKKADMSEQAIKTAARYDSSIVNGNLIKKINSVLGELE
ncbi:glycosyltransferase family 4 protein [Enterococcus lactis]|uniref:glycosyltransferase family 4 protein n=1 Tax=Enterococcus lactis TaxID=357441 RepID=UPI0040422AA7